jgi:hypothetical protein
MQMPGISFTDFGVLFAFLQICKTQNKKAKGYTLLNQ